MKIIWYIWFLKYKVQKTEIFVILDQFLTPYWAFYPPMDSKNQIFCMVPDIWSPTDRIFRHLGPFFLPFYAPPPPPRNNPKNQNFEKMKKLPGDIIILHRHTINDNHIMYDSWDVECERQNFLSFWIIFCSFTPLTQKIKILKKWKALEILSFYTYVP